MICDRSEVGCLFVVLPQPIIPSARCAPLFVIEGTSGIGNQRTQVTIEKVLETTKTFIKRVFIASNGNSSCNQRHHEFMKFWTAVLKPVKLGPVLKRIPEYLKPLPLSNLLHLAKNFRIRFLKYLLSFTCGGSTRSINAGKLLEVSVVGPPVSDLIHVGKIRDCHPFTIMRIKNIIGLIEQDALIGAVASLS
jgi:hypothetical protein